MQPRCISSAATCVVVFMLLAVASCDPEPDPEPIPGPGGYDGDWQELTSLSDSGAFLSIWGRSATEVYLVGGQPDDGRAFVYDGTQLDELTLPDGPQVYWVHGTSQTTWFVGDDGLALRSTDGQTFEVVETPTDQPLWGVWAAAEDDIWAVGGDARLTQEPAVLLHWDGQSWTEQALPELDRDGPALFKVWGTSADNVYAVGSRGVLLHYDGSQWTQELAGTAEDLISLWGNGPDNIMVAGGRANGVVARWNGTEWQSDVLTGVPGLNGVWMDDNGIATFVGVRASVVQMDSATGQWAAEDVDSTLCLHGVWGTTDGARISGGGSLLTSPPFTGLVVIDEAD
ncbi:MAG: hypothetical protein KC561_06010 [Myxococcales bacterium]|nr:hypothetical protein [Myxococcales bacterium]